MGVGKIKRNHETCEESQINWAHLKICSNRIYKNIEKVRLLFYQMTFSTTYNLSQIFFGLIVMMERSPVVLQELSAADLITDLFVKIFPSAVPELSPIRQYPDI